MAFSRIRQIPGAAFVLAWLALCGQALFADAPADNSTDRVPVLEQSVFLSVPSTLWHLSDSWSHGQMLLRIGPDGSVLDWIPIDLPHYGLVAAIGRALERARFTPPLVDGRPVAVDIVATIPLHNVTNNMVTSMNLADHIESRTARLSPDLFRLVVSPPDELDAPLRLLSYGDTYNVVDEDGTVLSGTVLIDFYVDPDGYPRMMRAAPGADPVLGDAAIMTVSSMRFAPPMRDGRPAVVKARIPMVLGD